MRTEPAPEIVEIIDDDGRAFFDSPPGPSINRTRGSSRWVGPVAAVTFLALVGYGVLSSATTNPPAPTTPLTEPQYYVATAPTGFSMYLAEARGETGIDPAAFSDNAVAELWATSDASAVTGSWFVVSLGAQHSTGRNSYRTVVDGMEVVFEHDPESRQSRLSFTKSGYSTAITAFGWLDRQLVRLARSVNIDDSTIRFSDPFFTTDHARVLRADPETALFGLPVARVGYTTGLPTALAENFTITVSGDTVVDQAQVLKFALINTVRLTVGNLPAIVGQSSADARLTIAQWRDGERLITISGNLDEARLAAIARTVHESPSLTVRRALADSPGLPIAGPLQVEPKILVSGMLSDGWGWAIGVSAMNPADAEAGYLWWIGQPGDSDLPSETRPSLPGDAPRIDTLVEHGRTYILASVPRSMSGAELRVAPTGLPSIVTKLHEVDPTLPGEFAASVFLQPVTFTARIVDADGTTVAFWPA
ncbi:MAG: hypothetical protein ABI862_11010 [Ilumatobacteraceae bacterium]